MYIRQQTPTLSDLTMSCPHSQNCAMSCPSCGAELPKKGRGRPRLTDEERALRKKQSAAKWWREHGHERREKHLEANKVYYLRHREAILARLKSKRLAAKEAKRVAEEEAKASEEANAALVHYQLLAD